MRGLASQPIEVDLDGRVDSVNGATCFTFETAPDLPVEKARHRAGRKAPQPVSGGLLGVVPEEKQSWLIKKLIKFFFENKLTGLNSTLELAKPVSEIKISENHLADHLEPDPAPRQRGPCRQRLVGACGERLRRDPLLPRQPDRQLLRWPARSGRYKHGDPQNHDLRGLGLCGEATTKNTPKAEHARR
jgi:hypothetical protein